MLILSVYAHIKRVCSFKCFSSFWHLVVLFAGSLSHLSFSQSVINAVLSALKRELAQQMEWKRDYKTDMPTMPPTQGKERGATQ